MVITYNYEKFHESIREEKPLSDVSPDSNDL